VLLVAGDGGELTRELEHGLLKSSVDGRIAALLGWKFDARLVLNLCDPSQLPTSTEYSTCSLR
jgi:hypothetical protein